MNKNHTVSLKNYYIIYLFIYWECDLLSFIQYWSALMNEIKPETETDLLKVQNRTCLNVGDLLKDCFVSAKKERESKWMEIKTEKRL